MPDQAKQQVINFAESLGYSFDVDEWSKLVALISKAQKHMESCTKISKLLRLQAQQLERTSTAAGKNNDKATSTLLSGLAQANVKVTDVVELLSFLIEEAGHQSQVIMSHVTAGAVVFEMDLVFAPGKRVKFRHDAVKARISFACLRSMMAYQDRMIKEWQA